MRVFLWQIQICFSQENVFLGASFLVLKSSDHCQIRPRSAPENMLWHISLKGGKVTIGKILWRKKKKERKKKLLGQRESRIEILWTLTNSIRKKKTKKEKERREKRKKKKDSRVLTYSTCNKQWQYTTNCLELRKLQFSETIIFNIFWISYAIIFSKHGYKEFNCIVKFVTWTL